MEQKKAFNLPDGWAELLLDCPTRVRHELADALLRHAAGRDTGTMRPIVRALFAYLCGNTGNAAGTGNNTAEPGNNSAAEPGNSAAGGNAETKSLEEEERERSKEKEEETNKQDSKEKKANNKLLAKKEKEKAPAPDIGQRRDAFARALREHLPQYGEAMIERFFNYWAEANAAQTRMRFEMEKTWELKRRLDNWQQRTYNQHDTPAQQPYRTAYRRGAEELERQRQEILARMQALRQPA